MNYEVKEQLYEGKAKQVFATNDPEIVMVHYKDDATAGDGEKKGTIRDKGIVNNKLSNALMQKLEKEGIPTHYVQEVNDRDTFVKKVEIVPLEVIVRNVADDDLQRHDLDLLHKGVAVIDLLHVMGGDALLLELLHQSVGQLVVDNALVANGALLLTVTGSGVILIVDHDDLGIVGSENLLGLAFVQLLFNFVIHEKRSFL